MACSGKYSKATSSLPPDFVDHLRKVFDKLDKDDKGYIKISDLEIYWRSHYRLSSSVSNSPIIKRLNEIAPANMGLVSFPRLCAGVKEALMQARTHKNRKVSFIYALSLNEDYTPEDGKEVTEQSPIFSSTLSDENNNDVHCSTLSPKLPSSTRDCQKEIIHENDVQYLLDSGLQLLTQIKSWYSRQNSLFYNCEISQVATEDITKIAQLNYTLQTILAIQRKKSTPTIDELPADSAAEQVKIIKSLKDRISKLEGEKSLLIRELFQLKAQLKSKSPSSKPYLVEV